MASPQLENGHIRIANELFEALCRASLSGREFQVVHAIIRRTYGWGKKSDAISLKWLQDHTGITHRPWLMRLLQSLERQNVVSSVHRSGFATEYALNKNYEAWTCLSGGTCPIDGTCPMDRGETPTHVQVGGGVPSTGRGPLPMDENMNNHTSERHGEKPYLPEGKGGASDDASSPSSHPIQKHPIGLEYRTTYLNGGMIVPIGKCRKAWAIIKSLEADPEYYQRAFSTTQKIAKAFEWVREHRKNGHEPDIVYSLTVFEGLHKDATEANSGP